MLFLEYLQVPDPRVLDVDRGLHLSQVENEKRYGRDKGRGVKKTTGNETRKRIIIKE